MAFYLGNFGGLIISLPHGLAEWRVLGNSRRDGHNIGYLVVESLQSGDRVIWTIPEVEAALREGVMVLRVDRPLTYAYHDNLTQLRKVFMQPRPVEAYMMMGEGVGA